MDAARLRPIATLGVVAAALAGAPAASATPRGIGNSHWATTVEPFQWNGGYGGAFGVDVDASHADWDRAVSTAGSNRVAPGAADQEVAIRDVADGGQSYDGITYLRRDGHGALMPDTYIEVVAPASMSAFNRRLVYQHEIGHAKGLDHPADLYGACTEVMSYCGRVNSPSQAEIDQVDVQQGHLDSYTTLRGPLQDGSTPPPPPPAACADGLDNDGDGRRDYPTDPGCSSSADPDETDAVPPPPPPPSGSDEIEPNATVSRGLWSTDTGQALHLVLRDGVHPPRLPANDYDYAATRYRSSYELRLDDVRARAGRFNVVAYVHVDQYGSRTRSSYALHTVRGGARTRVALLSGVAGRVDGNTPGAWKQLVATGLSAAEVNALTFVGSKDRSSDGTNSGSVYNQAVIADVTPAAGAAAPQRLRFGAVERRGARFRYGLGLGGEAIVWTDRFDRGPTVIDRRTGLPRGVARPVERKRAERLRSTRARKPAG